MKRTVGLYENKTVFKDLKYSSSSNFHQFFLLPKLFFCNFTLPINLEREIIRMLQIHQIYFASFNILSFLSDVKMIKITNDFNLLDNKAFQRKIKLTKLQSANEKSKLLSFTHKLT